jgi:predicted methyltransferase
MTSATTQLVGEVNGPARTGQARSRLLPTVAWWVVCTALAILFVSPLLISLLSSLKTPAAANIVSVVRPFDDPAPTGMHDFDLVTFFYAYHDITYQGVDRAKMHKAFYNALKPGGELVVGDYSAKPGAGTSVVQTLHRSEEALVTSEIDAAGFKLIERGDFLHVPGDTRDTHSHSAAQPVDIYVLKFRKPG